MKHIFDKKVKADDFKLGDLVLKWDAIYEDKCKHGKFDDLWKGPYKVSSFIRKKSFFLIGLEDVTIELGTVNGRFLKHYLS